MLPRSVTTIRKFAFLVALILLLGRAHGAATQLAITSVNGGANPNDVTPFSVVIQAHDSLGMPANVTSDTVVMIADPDNIIVVTGNSYLGTIMAGSNSVTISNVLVGKAQTGLVLMATALSGDALTPGSSAPFNVLPGPPAEIGGFVTTVASASGPIQLTIVSVDGSFDNDFTNVAQDTPFQLELVRGSGILGGTLTGTIPAGTNTVYVNVTYSKPETISILVRATGGDSLQPSPFDVEVADVPVNLVVSNHISTTTAPFALTVISTDSNGIESNVRADTLVTLTQKAGPGTPGGTLTETILAGTSRVTFPAVTYTAAGSVTFTATPNGDASLQATDSTIAVSGPPAGLMVSTTTSNNFAISAGIPFEVDVSAVDTNNNLSLVSQDTVVQLSVSAGAGTLSGTLTATIPAGKSSVSLFAVAYSQTDTNVQIRATRNSGDTLTAGDSDPFNVAGSASAFQIDEVFNGTGNATVGLPFSSLVHVLDGAGNEVAVTSDTMVTLSLAAGDGQLSGTLTGTIAAGQSEVLIPGHTYDTVTDDPLNPHPQPRLQATAGVLMGTSGSFQVRAAATHFVVNNVRPPSPIAGEPFSVDVTAKNDNGAKVDVPDGTSVILTLGSGSGTLGGMLTTTIGTLNTGSVTASGLIYSKAESGVSVTATASTPSLNGTSALFTVLPGGTIAISAGNNQSATVGTPVAIAPAVIVKDSGGNLAAGVSVTFAVATGNGSVTGAQTSTDASGVARAGSWTIGSVAGMNTLTATAAGLPGGTVTFSATGTPTLLALTSGPMASPMVAGVGQTISFSTGANVPGTSFTWNFGDGATDASGNALVSHAFTSAGTFSVTVTATNGAQVVSGTVAVIVNGTAFGSGNDSNGDGFSDAFDTAFGLNAADPAQSPVPAGTAAGPLSAAKMSIRLNFARADSDSLILTGTLPIPAGFNVNGAKLGLAAGDLVEVFTLNSKGIAKSGTNSAMVQIKFSKGTVAAQTAKYTIKLAKASLAGAVSSAGLVNGTVTKKAVTLSVVVVLSQADRAVGLVEAGAVSLHYSAKQGKSGSAK